MRKWTAVVSGIVLIVGFGVAQGTGNRSLGGVVLFIGAAYCVFRWWQLAGALRALLSLGVFAVAFIASHPLGKAIGSWPSVLFVALVTALSAYALTSSTAKSDQSGSESR